MTTISDINAGLVEVFEALRNGTMEAKDAVEINNTAGKIIAANKVQIAYHALREEAPDIPFLAAASATPIRGRVPYLNHDALQRWIDQQAEAADRDDDDEAA
tara:strand:- start:2329 stop:2634 length:306 start_codon:yes stop_codon:yes gene_type:complete